MSDLLNIASSGLSAYRNALAAVSDNVVNANSDGYVRRTVTLSESAVGSGNAIYYQPQTTFGGVTTAGVTRMVDQFRVADARLAMSDDGQAQTKLDWLTQVENNLDDSAAGVGKQVTAFYNAGDALAANPTDTNLRSAFLMSLDGAASAFRTTATNLTNTSNSIATQTGTLTDQVNSDLAALAKVNVDLRRTAGDSSAHAQMEDQRDKLLDDLAGKVGINISTDSVGAVSVSLAGAGNVSLLNGTQANFVGYDQSADGRIGLLVSSPSGRTPFTAQGGSLQGLVDVSGQLADRRVAVDQLASDFSSQVNSWSAQGVDQNGAAGGPLLSSTGGAAGLASLVTDPGKVAAASTDGTANGNLLTLSNQRGTNGIEARWNALVTSNAQITAAAKSNGDITSARLSSANSARDDVSGVDLDTEAADLLRYQQAYSASASVLKTARETIQTILDIV